MQACGYACGYMDIYTYLGGYIASLGISASAWLYGVFDRLNRDTVRNKLMYSRRLVTRKLALTFNFGDNNLAAFRLW